MDRLKKIGFSKLTALNDALNSVKNFIKINNNEEIDVNLALNRILAVDIESELDIPPFERAAMDGYALKAKNTFEASPKNPKILKLKGKIEIGEVSDINLIEGEAIRISTGAAIPEGADAVIKIEETEIEGEMVKLLASVAPSKNIAKKGEDIRKGARILTKGCDLKPEHIALLSSLGFSNVKVAKKTTVSIFATGDELLEPGESIKPNKIFNSNTPMISSLVKLYGGLVIRQLSLKDDIINIEQALREAEKDSQVIIFTGGTSVGTKDFLPEIMERIGNIMVHGIAMRPGSPILIGSFKNSIVFCLPGTPVAAYIGFLTVAGPTVRNYMGCTKADPRIKLFTTISKDVPVSTMGYINHLRVKLEKRENELFAIPIRLKGSGIISSLTESDGIIEIPPFKEGLKQGERFLVKLHPK
ncbi:MAG: gephyrin-like molybdotransferase Glp [Candidatus Thorarchaeota archaeon]